MANQSTKLSPYTHISIAMSGEFYRQYQQELDGKDVDFHDLIIYANQHKVMGQRSYENHRIAFEKDYQLWKNAFYQKRYYLIYDGDET